MSIRIVVCLDFDTDSAAHAYEVLHRIMPSNLKTWPEFEGWESSEEWFGADGEPMTEDEISKCRMSYFEKQAIRAAGPLPANS